MLPANQRGASISAAIDKRITPIGTSTTAARRETNEASGRASASVAKPIRRSSSAASVAGSSGVWALGRIMGKRVLGEPRPARMPGTARSTLASVAGFDCRCAATLAKHLA